MIISVERCHKATTKHKGCPMLTSGPFFCGMLNDKSFLESHQYDGDDTVKALLVNL